MSEEKKRALRDVFGRFATGVTVVTTREAGGAPRGFTANSFSSVSLDPPLVLVCIAHTAHSAPAFRAAPHFGINILCEDQKGISNLFASHAADKFEQTGWTEGAHGVPLLPDSLATLVCAQHRLVDAGDHVILIGEVLETQTRDAPPLGYHRGSYFSIGLEDKLTGMAAQCGAACIGAIIERGGDVLLRRGENGGVCIPAAPPAATSLAGLTANLAAHGLNAQLDHLYAVYEDPTVGRHVIVYHGTVSGDAPDGMFYCALDDIPLDDVASPAERATLAQYAQEYRHGQFGVYQGDAERGTIYPVPQRNAPKG
ncbi:flavin reductase family protein [Roseovarius sp. M141]|uniref:flavin reductase family protein n=1 Tax=Roseovarius sp. M141 TaxID=2583806 RepID=UPI0020CB9EAD|nr:flavin reductase family protein [Roseovarius sp. M141]MCQ0091886.1 flavin reductase family protein [Roseovarius sp. M141]